MFTHLFSPCVGVIKKPRPHSSAAGAGIIIALQDLPSPRTAGIDNNNKKKGSKLNNKQNQGSKQRTCRNNGGVDGNEAVGDQLIHNQKKNPGTSAVPGSAFNLLYQPHNGTALSGRSRRMFSVIRLMICFFIFVFTPFSCVYFLI